MIRKVLATALIAGATLAVHSGTAHAGRKMLVLIDASGSMTTARSDGQSRYQAAVQRSDSMILNEAMMGLDGVAIYTFQDTTATPRTAGFVDVNTARTALLKLDDVNGDGTFPPGAVPPNGVTPLAGSMCDAIDALVGATTATDIRIMQLSSDGLENATDTMHPCWGPDSDPTIPSPFEDGSWQNKVYNKAVSSQPGETDATVNVRVDLFNYAPVIGLLAATNHDVVVETGPTTMATKVAARTAAALAEGVTLEDFFGALARDTGGQLSVIDDNMALPVVGDISDDGCVDFYDTLQVAVRFGQKTPAVDGKYDRDADGTVTFNDYLNVLAHVTPECVANSHVVAENLHCKGGSIVVDGKFIDDAATTITAYGSCKLTIKNSIIVAGDTALKIYGSARVKLENSHVIAGNTLVDLWGAAVVSAKNSSLKGQVKTTGAVVFLDLGGNTWY
jgi:hypothetical protein